MNKPRVLLIAENANPYMVSVPLEGWSHSRAIADLADVHVVTQIRNRESFLKQGLIEGKDFTALDTEFVAKRIDRIGRFLRGGKGKGWTTWAAFVSLGYYTFEKMVWKRFRADLLAGKYDLVHRLIPLSPTTPSKMAARCARIGVPFIVGPLNGGVPWPKGFESVRRQEKEWLSYVRGAYKLMPGYGSTRKKSAAILIGSRDTFAQMHKKYHDKCFYVPENAIDPARFTVRRTHATMPPIRLVFVGRLVPYKGADIVLDAALPFLIDGSLTLEIIGDGPQMQGLKDKIAQNELSDKVTLAGWVKHRFLAERLIQSDVFVFPSIREFGGAVALEAMAVGLVPIVVNYGGPGELVTPKTGFLLDMAPRESIVQQLRDLLGRLVADPGLIDERSQAAYERAHGKFTWQAKAKDVLAVYEWVLGRADKPHFAMPVPD